ncbi:hypothetical protein KBX19_09810 [Corynebacterium sp. CCUG 71335]|uniref:hypothetical protein n=1 Tax=Corynebacterium sp. CCUG 71335 TaxID=2823892 RepID=UPI00210991A0|nr:hypothetical protein [Corynebacterium sp. CCUG 71335]MCQ4621507.1 hypothetical protein [Corynebacterium sp. CCUG 71335]
MSPRKPPHFAGADPWFEQHGYVRKGRFPSWVKDLTDDLQIVIEASASFYGEHNPKTSLEPWIRLPKLAKLDQSFYAGTPIVPRGNHAAMVLAPVERSIFDTEEIPLELSGCGPDWDSAIEQLEPGLNQIESYLLDKRGDLRNVLDGPYFKLWHYPYAELLIILDAGDYEGAQQWLDAADYEKLINPRGRPTRPDEPTPAQQHEHVRAVVSDFVRNR